MRRGILISGAKLLGLALIFCAAPAHAFNIDGDKALLEPPQTLIEASQTIDAQKAKCPYEFFTKSYGLAYFHLKKGEVVNGVKVPDDRTVVQGAVCQESVYSWTERTQKRLGLSGLLTVVFVVGLLGGGMLTAAMLVAMAKPNWKIQHPEGPSCS